MAANVESLGALERRVSMSVQVEEIDRQVDERLKKLARDVRMPGFRPGKVPLKLVAQTYGPQVRSEVLGDAVQKAFTEVVKEANLRVAGYPRIEKKAAADDKALEFSATFEIYPRSEEHTSELQSHHELVCRLLLEKKKHVVRGSK